MRFAELQKKNASELTEELDGLYQEQFALRMQKAVGQLARPDRVKKVRREIAQIQTLINQRKRAG
ncbi:50S ribosomal protein L29 [Thioalkalivibrio sp.]|uniref:50S ribosomal protein L29 n=1 Tax=Thioalkalivibrio sp. TaxID=2093813 RepID=UPI001BC01303|nr:50S ribosomal protein L29 [Thioalkalivibrio sp.]